MESTSSNLYYITNLCKIWHILVPKSVITAITVTHMQPTVWNLGPDWLTMHRCDSDLVTTPPELQLNTVQAQYLSMSFFGVVCSNCTFHSHSSQKSTQMNLATMRNISGICPFLVTAQWPLLEGSQLSCIDSTKEIHINEGNISRCRDSQGKLKAFGSSHIDIWIDTSA